LVAGFAGVGHKGGVYSVCRQKRRADENDYNEIHVAFVFGIVILSFDTFRH
jgi:hypothetical protein